MIRLPVPKKHKQVQMDETQQVFVMAKGRLKSKSKQLLHDLYLHRTPPFQLKDWQEAIHARFHPSQEIKREKVFIPAFYKFLQALCDIKADALFQNKAFILPLYQISKMNTRFLRPVEAWKPKTHNVYRLFSDLLRHLFAKYPIPAFMDQVFEQEKYPEFLDWYCWIGEGESLRKKPIFHFRCLPKRFTFSCNRRHIIP